jgi:hypothetical protein
MHLLTDFALKEKYTYHEGFGNHFRWVLYQLSSGGRPEA